MPSIVNVGYVRVRLLAWGSTRGTAPGRGLARGGARARQCQVLHVHNAFPYMTGYHPAPAASTARRPLTTHLPAARVARQYTNTQCHGRFIVACGASGRGAESYMSVPAAARTLVGACGGRLSGWGRRSRPKGRRRSLSGLRGLLVTRAHRLARRVGTSFSSSFVL